MAEKEMAQKIKDLRTARNMTLEQVANIVGVGKSTVRKWETGMIANMRRDKIALLASSLGTTPAFLMGWENNSGDRDLYLTAIDVAKWLDTDPEVVEAVMSDMGWPDVTSEILSKISAEVERRKIRILAHGESALIKAFLKLNNDGQQKAVERVEELAEIPKYQRIATQEAPESPPPARAGNAAPSPDVPKTPQEGE